MRFQPRKDWRPSFPTAPLCFDDLAAITRWSLQNAPQLVTLTIVHSEQPLRETLDPFFTRASEITVCTVSPLFLQSRPTICDGVSDEMAFRHDGMAAIARYFYPRNTSPTKTEASLRPVLTWREPMGSLAPISDVIGRRFRTTPPHAVSSSRRDTPLLA